MDKADNNVRTPDKRLAAVCGLFCPACRAFIATREDPVGLAKMAERWKRPLEEMQCNGCRSDKRCFYCETKCTMAKCAAARGVEFCGECADYPCKELKAFQAEMPHRIELWNSQARIKEAGYETWYEEMLEHYSCQRCGTINSAYAMECRKCGTTPSCAYVSLHKDKIMLHMAKLK
jgi:ribosomal protein L40E